LFKVKKIKKQYYAITLTRGDTLRLKVGVIVDDAEYTPQLGDTIRFAAKHNVFNKTKTDYMDETPVIKKDIPYDTLLLQLDPEDTKHLGFGNYAFDVQITFMDGTVDTFIEGELHLTKEVD